MPLTQEQKQAVLADYRQHPTDTGSSEAQIALLTARVEALTEHLKLNSKDFATRRGLLMLVGKRRRLLRYYRSKHSAEQYKVLIDRLNIRK